MTSFHSSAGKAGGTLLGHGPPGERGCLRTVVLYHARMSFVGIKPVNQHEGLVPLTPKLPRQSQRNDFGRRRSARKRTARSKEYPHTEPTHRLRIPSSSAARSPAISLHIPCRKDAPPIAHPFWKRRRNLFALRAVRWTPPKSHGLNATLYDGITPASTQTTEHLTVGIRGVCNRSSYRISRCFFAV